MAQRPDIEPLKPPDAKKLIWDIVTGGIVAFSGHALEEMEKDDMETPDCLNVLRGGAVGPAEYINDQWRYRVTTPRMCVVVTFVSSARLRVVTAWRIKR